MDDRSAGPVRVFDRRDTATSPPVAVISAALARRHFAGEDPIGQRLKHGGRSLDNPWMEIIGVVGDVKYEGLDVESAEQLAAIASGLFSLSRGAGLKFGGNETVRQVIVELDDTLLFVASAGSGSVLAVLAGREADAGVLGYEMSQLINSVRPFLTTPTRSTDQRSR